MLVTGIVIVLRTGAQLEVVDKSTQNCKEFVPNMNTKNNTQNN